MQLAVDHEVVEANSQTVLHVQQQKPVLPGCYYTVDIPLFENPLHKLPLPLVCLGHADDPTCHSFRTPGRDNRGTSLRAQRLVARVLPAVQPCLVPMGPHKLIRSDQEKMFAQPMIASGVPKDAGKCQKELSITAICYQAS